ncbi:hypothetical protein LIER_29401 [Lithospermum erythrorhizon]|uniref:Uncharacterized protein n=1 Tax=Lithospermum erythrorhizon TaxID=34254 RepID=A0AAV3RJ00_LITER
MVNSKKLLKMARKLQRCESSEKKIISLSKVSETVYEDCCTTTTTTTTSMKTDRGQFVVYSYDRQRFTIPLHFLNNEIFVQLLNISEEEYGLSRDGPIVLPINSELLSYIISVIKKGLSEDVREALLMSVDMNRCSLSSFNQGRLNEHLLVC